MRLLVADDDVSVRNLVNLALEIRGFDVVSVRNGVEALEMIANSETAFKMVILDVTMPKLGGIDTLRQMRTVKGYEDVPVLFLTGNDDANVDDLPNAQMLMKPFDIGDLFSIVDSVRGAST